MVKKKEQPAGVAPIKSDPHRWPAEEVTMRAVSDLIPSARNARTHSDEQVAQIAGSIREWGWTTPILIDPEDSIIAGHGRVLAAQRLGIESVPVMVAEGWSEAKKRAYMIADNKLAENAGWDWELLASELHEIKDQDFDLDVIGFNSDELDALLDPGDADASISAGSLSERFGVAPFSVLNAREGWWQERKRAWLALGIRSEIGRGDNLLNMSDTVRRGGFARTFDQDLMRGEHVLGQTGSKDAKKSSGTSIFDPVLCELAYRWFSPPDGVVLDPFAGGSVRGIVASRLGRSYLGIDLSADQIAANESQAELICGDPLPQWICADSQDIEKVSPDGFAADFIFSCPPYADLEVYSDNPLDLSTMEYDQFLEAYQRIIQAAVDKLKDNRFACFVVGDVRDRKGIYRQFPAHTVQAFEKAGAGFYNDAILVTATGSLALRVGRMFTSMRKLGKTHQNVLVFCKGDPKKAVEAIGEVEFGQPTADADSGTAEHGAGDDSDYGDVL